MILIENKETAYLILSVDLSSEERFGKSGELLVTSWKKWMRLFIVLVVCI
jgi:hypothetical protein